MGFGGGNGFSPSRTIVEDSTKTGNDASQKHQFTGSVEISGGPLKLDGASITPGGGGGGTPGGSDTQVQYNDGGAFGGDTQFFYNDSINSLTVGGRLMVGASSTPLYTCHLTSSSEVVLTLQGPGDVGIRLCADTDGGPGENDNPYIDWYQDGQQPTTRANRLATIAMVGDATNPSASFTGSLENALYIDTFCPNAKHTNVRIFQIATDAKYNKWNDQPSPRQGSHTARMTIEGERGFVGIGDNNAPTAVLHVSSSQGTPLFRVDHTGSMGPEPILFVTGSGLVGIGTAAPRTDSADTNRVHIMGKGGADQGRDPVPNTLLMLENNSHAAIQFMTPAAGSRAGIIAWGSPTDARLANLYYTSDDNRYTFEGPGFGDKRVMTLRASGDSMNVGTSDSGHMETDVAALHISASTDGNSGGGPVLLQVDHFDQPGGEPTLFVTGSGKVGIGTKTPSQALEVASTSTQQKWSYDADSFATLTVADDSVTTLASGESGNILIDAGGDIFLEADGGQIYMGDPGGDTKLKFDVQATTAYIDLLQDAPLIFRLGSGGASEIARFDHATDSFLLATDSPVQFRDTATKINSPSANVLTLTGPTVDVAGTFSLNSSNVTSTAPELNLLDASTVTAPAEGVWAGVERVAVLDIGASEYSVAAHTLGVTIPDKAIITRAILDVGTAFGIVDPTSPSNLGLQTTGNIFPVLGAPAAPIDFFVNLGGSPTVNYALLTAQTSFDLTFEAGKLNGASTITFTVVGGTALTTGSAKVYIYYIMGS